MSAKTTFCACFVTSVRALISTDESPNNAKLTCEEIVSTCPAASFFTNVRLPSVTIARYAERLMQYMRCSPECYVYALIYLRRVGAAGVPLNRLTIHRLLSTALIIAAKMRDDTYYGLSYYAQVTGFDQHDVKEMEEHLLGLLHFDAGVQVAEYMATLSEMLAAHSGAVQAQQPNRPKTALPVSASQPQFEKDATPATPSICSSVGPSSAAPSQEASPATGAAPDEKGKLGSVLPMPRATSAASFNQSTSVVPISRRSCAWLHAIGLEHQCLDQDRSSTPGVWCR